MSISSAMNTANTGLNAASRRADIVANNIANALTPGYSRRDIVVGENVLNGQGAGVSVVGVVRAQDQALTNDRRIAESSLNQERAATTTYASFNTALGEPGDSFGLFAQYQNLETALKSLSLTPESQPLQAQLLDATKSLATTFNQLSAQAQSTRQTADNQIAQQVNFVNNTVKQVENLNNQISLLSAGGRDSSALLDQRQTLVDEISGIIPVREIPRDNNKIDLMTTEGVFLLATSPRALEFSPANGMTPQGTLGTGDLSGLSVRGTTITPGTGGSLSVHTGNLVGLFQIRDEIAPSFQTQLDGLARDVIERFENSDTTLAPGAAGLFTDSGSAFSAATELGLAGRIKINAIVDPAQGGNLWQLRDGLGSSTPGPTGNADIVFALLDGLTALQTPPPGTGLSGQLSAIEAAANVSSLIGTSRINAETQLAATTARHQALSEAELSATGVSTDQELQKLLLIERAFSANAKVIQTANDLIRQLLEL